SIVTLPVLVTVNVYSTVLPSADSTPVLTNDNDGSAGTSTTVGISGSPGSPGLSTSGEDGTPGIGSPGWLGSVGSNGGVPVTVALFSTSPASFSACVTVYVAVPVATAPGVSVVTSSVTPSGSFTSVISTPVIVTL